MKKLLAMISVLPVLALSQTDGGTPFVPVHAWQQQALTSRSLQEEFDQFRALSQGVTVKTQYEVAKRKFAQAKLELDRSQTLLNSGNITEVKFAAVYYDYRQLEADVIRLPVEMVKAQLTAQFHRLRVLEEGNPDQNHEPELVDTMIKGVDSETETLNASLNLANTAYDLAEKYWEHGQELLKKSAISQEQQELREMAYQNSAAQVDGLKAQIELAKTARASLQESQKRLQAASK